MAKSQKLKPRLPVGVVKKLQDNTGGGSHRSKRDYNRKKEKEALRRQLRGM